MNYQKYTIGGLFGIFRHCDRSKNSRGEYIKYRNQNIDTTRTHLNYNLGPDRGMTQYEFLKKRLSELTYRKQKNNIVCCSWIVTAPEGIVDPEEKRNFFKVAYDELCKRYGEENVISCYCHLDEGERGHIHFLFVPATQDAKLSASRTTSRKVLLSFHDEMEKSINERLKKNYRLVNDIGERAKYSVPVETMKKALHETELNLQVAKKQNADKAFHNQELLIESYDLMEQNQHLKWQFETLQNELQLLQNSIQELKETKYSLIGQRESIKREIKNLNIIMEDDNNKLLNIRHEISEGEKEAFATLGAIDKLQDELHSYQQDLDYIRDSVSEALADDLQNIINGQHIQEYDDGFHTYNYDDYELEL